jgi:hypothetical protein
MYSEISGHPATFNSSSIPLAIVKELEKQNLKKVSWSLISANIFNDTEKLISVEFYLGGEDISSFTINRTNLARTFTAKTSWIRFAVKLTNTFTLNFTKYFTKTVDNWQKTNVTINGNLHTAFYYYSTVEAAPFDASCYFVLPLEAQNIKAVGNSLVFEMPPITEDKLLDSPIIILGAVIIANIILIVYRKIRR